MSAIVALPCSRFGVRLEVMEQVGKLLKPQKRQSLLPPAPQPSPPPTPPPGSSHVESLMHSSSGLEVQTALGVEVQPDEGLSKGGDEGCEPLRQ